jgi:hypothetical protein
VAILVTSKTKRIPGPDTLLNCHACGPDLPANTYQLEEKMGVFFIPLITQRRTYVECSECGAAWLTRLPLAELGQYSAEELTPHLKKPVSFVVKFIALASLLLFWVPLVGFALSVIGLLASYWTGGWPKRVSLIALVLAFLISVLFVILLINGK